jgi:hypothetical protein
MLLFLLIEMVVESRETVTSRKDHEKPGVQHHVMGQGRDIGVCYLRKDAEWSCREEDAVWT